MTANLTRPVMPRDAASLVLMRRHGGSTEPGDIEILMGRRAPRHAFLPDHYVFPGGRLDAEDWSQPPASPMRPRVLSAVARSCPPARAISMAQALGVAAIRETYEETGLVLGRLDGGADLRPALGNLDYIARAITPPASPIRFHARFFLADASHASGEVKSNGELLDLRWLPVPKALALPVADVTEYVLEEVMRLLRRSAIRTGIPLFSYRNGKPVIRYE